MTVPYEEFEAWVESVPSRAPRRGGYGQIISTRKLSTAKLAEQRQDELSKTWQHLMESARFSVRDFFHEIGEGNLILKTFRAITDRSGGLNNFSLKFWAEKAVLPTETGH